MRLMVAAVLAIFALVGSADAAQRLSRQDQQILSQLSPQARSEVLSRLTPGETVKEIVETMALNRQGRHAQAGALQDRGTRRPRVSRGRRRSSFQIDP